MKTSTFIVLIIGLLAFVPQLSAQLVFSPQKSIEGARFQLSNTSNDTEKKSIRIIRDCGNCPSKLMIITSTTEIVDASGKISDASSLIANITYNSMLISYQQDSNEIYFITLASNF